MASKHYSRRFLAGLQRVYLVAVPLMLICILLANTYVYDAYYRYIYPMPFQRTVRQAEQYWQQHGRLAPLPGVRYRPLPAGTRPYTHFTEFYAEKGPGRNETHYTTTMRRGAAWMEVTVIRHDDNSATPGGGLLLFSVTVSLLLFLLLSWLLFQFSIKRLSYNLWRPFYQNLRRINAFSLRDRQRLELTPSDIREFGFFNAAITNFTDKIQQSYDELREFTENTAHELQTPLAVLLTKTELLLRRNRLEAPDRQELVEIKKTVQRLSALQKALNLLSRVRALQYGGALSLEPVDVGEQLRERLAGYEELLEYRQVRVQWQQERPWLLLANQELLGILLDNLVRNAIQHNVPGGSIGVEINAAGLVLRNTGLPPSAPEPDLFRRYHSRSTDDGRLGLGLALVEATCEVLQLQCRYHYHAGYHVFFLTPTPKSPPGQSAAAPGNKYAPAGRQSGFPRPVSA